MADFPLGIDVESTTRTRDWLALADKVFVPGERARLRQLPEAGRRELFYRYWTLREAAGKREGTGLRLSGAGLPCACESEAPEACAATWNFGGFCLAVVGEAGMRSDTAGIPEEAHRTFWSFADM